MGQTAFFREKPGSRSSKPLPIKLGTQPLVSLLLGPNLRGEEGGAGKSLVLGSTGARCCRSPRRCGLSARVGTNG